MIGEIELAARFLPRTHRRHHRLERQDHHHGAGRRDCSRRAGLRRWSAAISARRRSRWLNRPTPETVAVLEVSSFQLETIETFRPKIAVVLNVTPDHLDRHHTFEAYVDAKARIFENQQADDFAVLNADDATCVETGRPHPGAGVLVQPQERSQAGSARARGRNRLSRTRTASREIMPVSEIPLKGAHNVENVLAAVCVGALLGCEPAKIRAGGARFQGRRAPPGVRRHHSRRGILQRLQGHERGCDHQGAGIVPRATST